MILTLPSSADSSDSRLWDGVETEKIVINGQEFIFAKFPKAPAVEVRALDVSAPLTPSITDVSQSDLHNHPYPTPCPTEDSEKPFVIGDRFRKDEIRQIPDEKIIELLYRALQHRTGRDQRAELKPEHCTIASTVEGSFNRCWMISTPDDNETYVVRIPFAGTKGSWTPSDGEKLVSECVMMQYIRRMASVPVPEVVAFSDGKSDSRFDYPYTIMTRLPGKSAFHIWIDKEKELDDQDYVGQAVLERRHNFLRSLAHTMAQLQKISFSSTGVPDWTEGNWSHPPKMQPRKVWDFLTPMAEGTTSDTLHAKYDPTDAACNYFIRNINTRWRVDCSQEDLERAKVHPDVFRGINTVLHDTIQLCEAFSTSRADPSATKQPESFVLSHNDLDLQNILVDDDGNVTGILDWDGFSIVPRCIGYATFPLFLRKDWLPQYSLGAHPFISLALEDYRTIYADAMLESGTPDARYTRKSPMYHAIHATLYEGGNELDLFTKLFSEIPELKRMDPVEILQRVGKGNGPLEEVIFTRLLDILRPDQYQQPTLIYPEEAQIEGPVLGPMTDEEIEARDQIFRDLVARYERRNNRPVYSPPAFISDTSGEEESDDGDEIAEAMARDWADLMPRIFDDFHTNDTASDEMGSALAADCACEKKQESCYEIAAQRLDLAPESFWGYYGCGAEQYLHIDMQTGGSATHRGAVGYLYKAGQQF
jgi:aminoglycoside phosphotransferase (APT) family kinase protein